MRPRAAALQAFEDNQKRLLNVPEGDDWQLYIPENRRGDRIFEQWQRLAIAARKEEGSAMASTGSNSVDTLAAAISNYLRRRSGVSLVEMSRDIEGFAGEIIWGSNETNVIVWDRMSENAIAAMTKLIADETIIATPSNLLVYAYDGLGVSLDFRIPMCAVGSSDRGLGAKSGSPHCRNTQSLMATGSSPLKQFTRMPRGADGSTVMEISGAPFLWPGACATTRFPRTTFPPMARATD